MNVWHIRDDRRGSPVRAYFNLSNGREPDFLSGRADKCASWPGGISGILSRSRKTGG